MILVIYFTKGIERGDNSTSIKIGDNNIPLEKCYYYYYQNENTTYFINRVECHDILLVGNNTEISPIVANAQASENEPFSANSLI